MKPYQERVFIERNELEEKITKLEAFLDGDLWDTVSEEEQHKLVRQLNIMLEYRNILNERIDNF